MVSSLRWVDRLAVGYLLGTAVLLLPGLSTAWVFSLCVGLHLAGVVSIVALSRADLGSPLLRGIREMYPLLLLLVLYGEVDLFVQLYHEPPGFDRLVYQWDQWLFGASPHLYLSQWLDGRMWTEVFHLLYLSYYLLLICAFSAVWWSRPTAMPRFAFIVTGMFISFVAIFVVFPVAGPLIQPDISLTTEGVFPSLVAWIYAPLTMNGIQAGAFPSSHVGMSVGIAFLLAPRRWWGRLALAGLVLGIAVSTVYGRFHYAIDAVAGIAAGGILYVVWARLYTYLQDEPALSSATRPSEPAIEPAAPSAAVSRKRG